MAENKFNREQIAIILVVVLFVFAAIVYFAYKKKGNDSNSNAVTAKAKAGFSTPATTARTAKQEKEEYKSQLDAYEEEQKKTDEQALQKSKRTKIGFDKTIKQQEQTEPAIAQVQLETHQLAPAVKTQSKKREQVSQLHATKTQADSEMADNSTTEAPKDETSTLPKRRRLNSASKDAVDDSKKQTEESSTAVAIGQAQIPVIVHGDQKAINNQRIRLRVTKAAKARNYIVDANQILTGTVTFHNDRIHITVYSFRSEGQTVRMKLFAYDNGELGIYAPSSTDKQIASQTAQTASNRVRISIPTPLGPMGVGGGAVSKKIQEREKQFEIPSQYVLTLSDSETEQ